MVARLLWGGSLCCALTSCGDDAGASDAGVFAHAERVELVHAFLSHEWDADAGASPPVGIADGDVMLALRKGRGHVLYVADLGCADPYEALLARDGDDADLLFRFSAPGHNACGSALYAMRVVLDPADASTRVTVYRQDDVDGPVERIGSASAAGDDADCAGLIECDTDAPCPLEGTIADGLGPVDGPDDTHGCAAVDVCGKAACVWRREACIMTCGTPDCAIAESFPVQAQCGP